MVATNARFCPRVQPFIRLRFRYVSSSSADHITSNTDSNPHQGKPVDFHDLYWSRSNDLHLGTEVRELSRRKQVQRILNGSLHRVPLLRVFSLELRSFVYRMGLQYKRRFDLFGLDVGPLHQNEAGHPRWNTRTRGCTLDMKSFLASRPWATMIDLEVYRDAWGRGAEWGEHSSCKQEKEVPAQESSAAFAGNNTKSQP